MNKLQTNNNGGNPFDLDDLRWIDDAIREAIEGSNALWGTDTAANSFIISGCNITGGPVTFNCSAGFICLKGEILRVDAHTLPPLSLGEIHYWDVQTSYDPSGSETFQNGSIQDTYEIRRGIIVSGSAPVDYMPAAATRLDQKIYDKLDALNLIAHLAQEAWHEVGGSGEPAFEDGWGNFLGVGGGVLKFYKDEWGNVTIKGGTATGNVGSSYAIFTLPAGYRPANAVWKAIPVFDISTSDKNVLLVSILNNWKVCPQEYMIDTSLTGANVTDPKFIFGDITFSTNT